MKRICPQNRRYGLWMGQILQQFSTLLLVYDILLLDLHRNIHEHRLGYYLVYH
ncbi:MAG: hypothetical protein ACLSIA_03885 [[Clostridium] innocuum]|nr:hypothetical protein [[Clostridium] innocuum]